MILNTTIYDRALYLFDDPNILHLYSTNIIQFQKTLYPFLANGVSTITNPSPITNLLVEITPPEGYTETIDGTGVSTYILSTSPLNNATFIYSNNGVIDEGATYDSTTNSVTFSNNILEGQEGMVEWYYAGDFSANFAKINQKFPLLALIERITDLLARALVLEWAKKQRNTLIDGIVNLLTDTDFKLYSPANSLKAKGDWIKQLQWEFYNLQTKLSADWISYNLGGYTFWA